MGADYIYNRNHDYYGCLPYYVPVDMTLLFYTGRCRNTVATIRTAVLFEARHTYRQCGHIIMLEVLTEF